MTTPSQNPQSVAIVGSGPAGLMAAFVAARAGLAVTIFEKRKGPGRKLLIAGSSGLNITYDCPREEFVRHYRVGPGGEGRFDSFIGEFPPQAWIRFIEDLGIPTFKGTSRRYFVESDGMKASGLLKAWTQALEKMGVRFAYGKECVDFECKDGGVRLRFADGTEEHARAACFALGGGSYEPQETPLRWPAFFEKKGLRFHPFEASNVGFKVAWPDALIREAEGKPVKNVVLRSSRGARSGDLVITNYGLEGTPVYFAGEKGVVYLDLKPDLTEQQIRSKLTLTKENLSPIRRIKRFLNLGEGALAMVFHLTPKEKLQDLDWLIQAMKSYPVELLERQPIAEAISSSGGLLWEQVDERLMLKKFPGVFVTGEMLDWDAPTGGFLLQGCVAQGDWAGRSVAASLVQRAL